MSIFGKSAAEAVRMADEAKSAAATALGRIEAEAQRRTSHEEKCDLRYGQIDETLKSITAYLRSNNRMTTGTLISAIGGLLLALGSVTFFLITGQHR